MKKLISLLFLSAIMLSSCSGRNQPPEGVPTGAKSRPPQQTATVTNTPKAAATLTQIATAKPTSAPTATAAIAMGSTVMLSQDETCRVGPNENYFETFAYFKNDKVDLNGRNESSDWVLVKENNAVASTPTCWLPVTAIEDSSAIDMNSLSVAEYEALPAPPTTITAPNGVCGGNKAMIIKWSPVVPGVEYKLYRNGELVADQADGRYYDSNMPVAHKATVFTYMVQAVNEYGTSPHTVAVSVTVCGKE